MEYSFRIININTQEEIFQSINTYSTRSMADNEGNKKRLELKLSSVRYKVEVEPVLEMA